MLNNNYNIYNNSYDSKNNFATFFLKIDKLSYNNPLTIIKLDFELSPSPVMQKLFRKAIRVHWSQTLFRLCTYETLDCLVLLRWKDCITPAVSLSNVILHDWVMSLQSPKLDNCDKKHCFFYFEAKVCLFNGMSLFYLYLCLARKYFITNGFCFENHRFAVT